MFQKVKKYYFRYLCKLQLHHTGKEAAYQREVYRKCTVQYFLGTSIKEKPLNFFIKDINTVSFSVG
jgi:hypothetical protein